MQKTTTIKVFNTPLEAIWAIENFRKTCGQRLLLGLPIEHLDHEYEDDTDIDPLDVPTAVDKIAAHFNSTPTEALLLTAVFCTSLNDQDAGSVRLRHLARFFDLDNTKMVQFLPQIETMIDKGLIASHDPIDHISMDIYLPSYTQDALVENKPYVNVGNKDSRSDLPDLIKQLHQAISRFNRGEYQSARFFKYWEQKFKQWAERFEVVRTILELDMPTEDVILFFEICGSTTYNNGLCQIRNLANGIGYNHNHSEQLFEHWSKKKSLLFAHGLIEFQSEEIVQDLEAKLTPKGRALYLGDQQNQTQLSRFSKELTWPEQIVARNLYFSNEDRQALDFLEQSLDEHAYEKMCARLKSKGQNSGVTAVLFGGPGTGKTESVYQIARRTGRAIYQIDLSETKSMWFGESEKQIKEIFDKYREMVKQEKHCPILFFNEADAVFNRRLSGEVSGGDRATNSIQNVLLDELERFEGILMATTNLQQNMDAAFERRFLFKIELQKPSAEIKQQIWEDKLPMMDRTILENISNKYNFSGGEIDNIVRKLTIHEVLHGTIPSPDLLDDFCRREHFSASSRRPMGY